LPSLPAARVGYAASDEVKAYMFFSSAFFAERQCQGRSKGERLGVLLGHFLGRAKKWHKKPAQRGAQLYARQKEKLLKL
jgi:hypothetical protein